jgi:hypothetical protein
MFDFYGDELRTVAAAGAQLGCSQLFENRSQNAAFRTQTSQFSRLTVAKTPLRALMI